MKSFTAPFLLFTSRLIEIASCFENLETQWITCYKYLLAFNYYGTLQFLHKKGKATFCLTFWKTAIGTLHMSRMATITGKWHQLKKHLSAKWLTEKCQPTASLSWIIRNNGELCRDTFRPITMYSKWPYAKIEREIILTIKRLKLPYYLTLDIEIGMCWIKTLFPRNSFFTRT